MTEPVHAAPPPLAEPKTPMWLPALGAALFFTVGLVWAATPPPQVPVLEPADAGSEGSDGAVDAAPAPSPAFVSVPAMPASAVASNVPPIVKAPPKAPRPRPKPPIGAH